MIFFFLFLATFSFNTQAASVRCKTEIKTVSQLDACLKENRLAPTKSTEDILKWKKELNISYPLEIEVKKVQEIVEDSCPGEASQKSEAILLSEEIEKILQTGTLQIKDWQVPNFPATGAMNYSMKASRGCEVKDLIIRMKGDVDRLLPDLMNVYNLGLAVDTTLSQGQNLQILARSLDGIYESIPSDAKISFVALAYGDEFRGGVKIEGTKKEVLAQVKRFILNQPIYSGGNLAEFVYGGSHIASKNLKRAHGLIFNWTNATEDNTQASSMQGRTPYTLRELNAFAIKNIHVIRNVFLKCR